MDNPLLDALRAKYESLRGDFGDNAADRLREVVDHLLSEIIGRRVSPRRASAGTAAPKKRGRRSWTPEQRETQRKKMEAYWAKRRGARRGKKAPKAAAASTSG